MEYRETATGVAHLAWCTREIMSLKYKEEADALYKKLSAMSKDDCNSYVDKMINELK